MDHFCYLCFIFGFVTLSCQFLAALCPHARKGTGSHLVIMCPGYAICTAVFSEVGVRVA